eukprot:TRINITY_DN72836_c0_g1_i1.p1 TRINITY_DN72836_c0_g1~~TRINITY_DN72836_c0_g1_i1.p1  ORF type:complete len:216 (+),score=27.54 TRINITY_DN72836_c0_g1_i1:48-650(+)
MDRTQRPESSGNKQLARTWSAPTVNDWTLDWDADVLQSAGPRWTLGNSDTAENFPDPATPPWLGPKKKQTRDTFIDKHARQWCWQPPPGHYKRLRQHDLEPHKELGRPEEESLGGLRDRKIPAVFSRSVRQTNLTDLRKERGANVLLPSSFHTPGPGAYTAYTTFGAPSGGTRKRFFATKKSDSTGPPRPVEKFHRNSER